MRSATGSYRECRVEEAIGILGMNVDAYSEAPNSYDSLGDAYRAVGRLEDASRRYEQTAEMAEQQDDARLPTYRASLEQVTQQLEDEP